VPTGTVRRVVGCLLSANTTNAHIAEASLQDDASWLVYGRGSVWGRKGRQKQASSREESRGRLLPSRELEFLLSHSPIWLAVVKTIAWHLLSVQMESQL